MVSINDISVTLDGNRLVIDAEVDEEGFWLKKVYIDTQDTYLSSGPSGDVVYEHDVTIEDATDECNSTFFPDGSDVAVVRKMRLDIPQEEICASLRDNFFIVYIEAGFEGDNDSLVIGTAMWLRHLYNAFLGWIREIERQCEVPRNFIYLYLQYQLMITAIRTCNVMEAINVFNKYFRQIRIDSPKGCGCRR